ncbi:MAG: hypothetical protein M3Z32_11785 [Acidobacteriota bacterium]|nr:hypothetical protein [Acidobacteriota bacterium]
MTFVLPELLAAQLIQRVPRQERSRYIAEALAAKLAGREQDLIRACEIANGDADAAAIERELDGLTDEIAEPWDHAAERWLSFHCPVRLKRRPRC